MLIKIKRIIWTKNYYIIAIILSLNAVFELAFQYRFETKIEIVYFFVLGFSSVVMIKNIVGTEKLLPVFYYFWPFIILFVNYTSLNQLVSLPLVVSSFIIVMYGKFKSRLLKTFILAANIIAMVIYLIFSIGYYLVKPEIDILEKVYSPDKKYVMVVEETVFATGEKVYVYLGRNIDFGVMGHYMPRKVKYCGHTNERTEIKFVDDNYIDINGFIIEIRGNKYIDAY